MQGLPAVGHVYPGSILQMPEQPSPGVALPSSHCSPIPMTLSPHTTGPEPSDASTSGFASSMPPSMNPRPPPALSLPPVPVTAGPPPVPPGWPATNSVGPPQAAVTRPTASRDDQNKERGVMVPMYRTLP